MRPPFLSGSRPADRAVRELGIQTTIDRQVFPRASYLEDPVTFDDDVRVVASLAPPPLPGTCSNFVDSGFTITWSSGSLDAVAALTHGTAVVATAPCAVAGTAGSYVARLSVVHRPVQNQASWQVPYRLQVSQTGTDTLTVRNAFLRAEPVERIPLFRGAQVAVTAPAPGSGTVHSLVGYLSMAVPSLVAFLQVIETSPPTYYVSPTGDDASAGSFAAPWRTIAHAATALSSGESVMLLDGSYHEKVVNFVDGITIRGQNAVWYSTADFCIAASGVDAVTIDGVEMYGSTTATAAAYLSYCTSWTLQSCKAHYFWRNGFSLYHCDSAMIAGNHVYDIQDNGESMGIRTNYCVDPIIDGNVVFSVGKEGIRDIQGIGAQIINNQVFLCWCGIAPNVSSMSYLVQGNYVHHCTYGIYPKHSIGNGTAWNYIRYNTIEDCSGACLEVAVNTPTLDYLRVDHNVFYQKRGTYCVYLDYDWMGSHFSCDYNMYRAEGSGPLYYMEIDPGSNRYYSVAGIKANTPYEQNGVEYTASALSSYGASGYALTNFSWQALDAVIISANNMTNVERANDWRFERVWYAGTKTNAYLIYDFGTVKSFTRAFYQPYGDDKAYSPKSVRFDKWVTGAWATVYAYTIPHDEGVAWIAHMGTAVSTRYARFWISNMQGSANEIIFTELEFGTLAET